MMAVKCSMSEIVEALALMSGIAACISGGNTTRSCKTRRNNKCQRARLGSLAHAHTDLEKFQPRL